MGHDGQLLIAENLVKHYHRGAEEVRALDGVSLSIAPGEFVAFVGPSGSGKSTLFNLLGALDNPDSGKLTVDGTPVFGSGKTLGERALTSIRRGLFGYVFQAFHLVPTLSALDNVLIPGAFHHRDGDSSASLEARARLLLDRLGLGGRLSHRPKELSGGEMQRVALARALLNRPRILLADEPTGNLDTARGGEIATLLRTLSREEGLAVLVVTHNQQLAEMADRSVRLVDGRLAQGRQCAGLP
jgi:ABC-type lipoprotein export system ATPase subunit